MKKKFLSVIRPVLKKSCIRLAGNGGETIVETLISVLIVAMCLTMLAGGIVSAANVNHNTKVFKTEFDADTAGTGSDGTVVLTHKVNSLDTEKSITPISVKVYATANGYAFYSTDSYDFSHIGE